MLADMSDTDLELLARYTQQHDEDSFAELVRRQLGLVYSAALRQVRSPQLAEEVSQSVFIDLARSRARLKPNTILTAWLYQVTRRTAIDVVRREASRQLREQIATEMNAMNAAAADWTHIEPLLDEAMHALDETDRAAVLLRYFENKSLREVGATLGTSENAAQKRLGRALERLREFFSKRGVTIGASGLAVAISANAVQAAPVGLFLTISTAAFGGTSIGAITTATATKAIAMTTTQKILITTVLAAAAGTGLYEGRQASILRTQAHMLQQQQAALTGQIQELRQERDEARSRLTSVARAIEGVQGNSTELLKLRGEVARLRGDSRELAELKAAEQNDPAQMDLKSWLARVKQLKEGAEKNPNMQIPEFRLLTEQDWLDAAKWFGRRPQFDAETDFRVAMAQLRQSAQNAFAARAQKALEEFAKANDGRFPSELAQLKAHFIPPMNDAILQRYIPAPAEEFGFKDKGQEWVITQRELVDEEHDQHIGIGPRRWGYKKPLAQQLNPELLASKRTLDPIAREFSAVNNGQEPTDPSQLLPYVKTPEQRSALQKLIEMRNSTPKLPEK
jgi:RNA polymerase sigma factor (sigma-70 family)